MKERIEKQLKWLKEFRFWVKNDPEAMDVLDGLIEEKEKELNEIIEATEGRR